MAFVQLTFFAETVKQSVNVNVFYPDRTPRPAGDFSPTVLILLHGWAGNQLDWVLGSDVGPWASDRGVLVVIPSGGNHFYLDDDEMGEQHAQFVARELPDKIAQVFGLVLTRERLFLGGYSMGGFGALRNGLLYRDRFGGIIALSSALIHHEVAQMQPGSRTDFAPYRYYERVFGPPRALLGSDRDPDALARTVLPAEAPRLYLACGTEDWLLEVNRATHGHWLALGLAHRYVEAAGGHDFAFWNQQIRLAVDWMLETVQP